MLPLESLRFITEDGRVFGIKHCKISSLSARRWLINFQDFTFIYDEDEEPTLEIVQASTYLEVRCYGQTLVKGDLRNFVGGIFTIKLQAEIQRGSNAPENPGGGDVWFNTLEERLYVYVLNK